MTKFTEELEFSSDAQFIWKLFRKHRLNDRIFHMDEKYLSTIVGRMVYDYRVMDNQSFVTSKWDKLSSFFLKILVIHGGAIMSIFRAKKVIRRINNTEALIKEMVIALPFADHIVRYKRLREMVDQDIYMYYPPLFHYNHVMNHIETYNSLGQQMELGVFRIKDIVMSIWVCFIHFYTLRKCSREIDSLFKSDSCKLPGVIIFCLLYKRSLERIIGRISDPEKKRIWLLDYDFDFKYAFFNDVIHSRRPKDITIHLQHGSFINYSDVYCNPSSDITLCCSQREKELIRQHNKHKAEIFTLGAPLQTFIDAEDGEKKVVYDVLLLLTTTHDESTFNLQVKFLSGFNFEEHHVLVRFRPASRTHDEEMLKEYIKKADISMNSSLRDDILSSRVVVSFSLDALFTCLRNNKRVVVVGNSIRDNYDFSFSSDNIYIMEDPSFVSNYDWTAFINEFRTCDYTKDQFAMANFGINDFNRLSVRFNQLLKEVCH